MGILNVDMMRGKGRELADMMQRRKLDVLSLQEARWKGNKVGLGFKLYYHSVAVLVTREGGAIIVLYCVG